MSVIVQRSGRARLLAAGFGPGGPRTMYGLGVIAAAKAAALVVMAGAIADGVVSVIHGSSAWHGALVWGLVAALARGLLAWAGRVASARAALGAKETLRAQLADSLVRTGSRSPGSATALATRGLDELDEYYGSVLPALTNAAVIPLLVGARILFADWISALVIVLTIPLVPLFMALVGMYTKHTVADATRALGRLSDHLVELARGLPVLVGLGRVEEQSAALERVSDDYRTTTIRTLRVAFLSSLILELISTISVAVVAVFIGLRLVNGSLPLETGLLVLVLAPECFAPFRQLGAAFHASQNGIAALESAQDIIDTPSPTPLTAADTSGVEIAAADADAHALAGVHVAHLTIRYADRTRSAVDDLTFDLPHRTTTALVGESGSGKSSILAVLAGRITDGVDGAHVVGTVRGIEPGRIAWVPQHPATVGETVTDELRIYGDGLPAELLESRIEQLSERFGIRHLLYDAPAQLSPGELRRLAFARALLRIDAGAELLLLDEPTAHLDDASARIVRNEIERLDGRLTIVLASHEPDLVRVAARRILVGTDAPPLAAERGRDDDRTDAARSRHAHTRPATTVSTGASLRQLAAFLRPARWRFAGAILLGAGSALFAASLTAVSGWLIVRASQEPNVMLLLVAIVGVRFFGIGRAVLRYAEELATHDAVFTSIGALRMRLWSALARRGASTRRLLTGGTSLDYLVLTADRIRDLAPRVVIPVGAGVLTAVAAVIAVAMLHAPAIPLLVACLLGCFLVAPPIALAADRRADRQQAVIRSTIGRRFTALVTASDDLRANGVDSAVRADLVNLDREAGTRAKRGAWALGAGHAVVIAVCCATSVGMLPVALPAIQAGTLRPEVLGVLALLPLGLIEPLLQVVGAIQLWPTLAQSLASACELDAPAALRPSVALATARQAGLRATGATSVHETEAVREPATLPERVDRLSLIDLGARWPEASEPAFTGVDADLGTGDWLVVSGPSGSGKSTLLTLLLGYLDPDSGRYLLNGLDSTTLDPSALRRHLAWAPQEGHLFDSTIRGNLLLARQHDDRPSDDELFDAVRRVGLGDLVASLPAGLDTRVGPQGSRLSGGQRQRLAVARTLLTRADVILLDEPTAHLDHDAASALIADLRAATRDKVTILVTHRASDVETGDKLIDLGRLTMRSPQT